MFKVLSPFVLICDIRPQRDDEPPWHVESIRFSQNYGVVLTLRRSVHSTVKTLAQVLDWKLVLAENTQGPTFKAHLQENSDKACNWLKGIYEKDSVLSNLAFWREREQVPPPPDCVQQNMVIDGHLAYEAEEILKWLVDDEKHWRGTETGRDEFAKKTLRLKGKEDDKELLQHLKSSYAAALRGSRSSTPLDFGGHLICALEERCVSLAQELQTQRDNNSQLMTPPISVAVTVERQRNPKEGEMILTATGVVARMPFKVGATTFLANLSFAYPPLPDYEQLTNKLFDNKLLDDKLATFSHSLFTFFQKHPSMKLSYGRSLRFSSIADLDRWINDNLKKNNENLEETLVLIDQWLQRQCPDLPPVQEETARARLRTATSTLIRKVARSTS